MLKDQETKKLNTTTPLNQEPQTPEPQTPENQTTITMVNIDDFNSYKNDAENKIKALENDIKSLHLAIGNREVKTEPKEDMFDSMLKGVK